MRLPNYREYIALPEYDWITKLLQKGIAVHQVVCPVFREMVEIFCKGYIKLLFATETFAVLICQQNLLYFHRFRLTDGLSIESHEYTQMAGRAVAGKILGYIFHLNNLFPTISDHHLNNCRILGGKPETLTSNSKITQCFKNDSIKQYDFKSY